MFTWEAQVLFKNMAGKPIVFARSGTVERSPGRVTIVCEPSETCRLVNVSIESVQLMFKHVKTTLDGRELKVDKRTGHFLTDEILVKANQVFEQVFEYKSDLYVN